MTTTTIGTTSTTSIAKPGDRDARRERIVLTNLKDELERFGWRAEDTSRYARQALRALPIGEVIKLFQELVSEERSYYGTHATLLDDQLDHTQLDG